jgi:hypothetical protein
MRWFLAVVVLIVLTLDVGVSHFGGLHPPPSVITTNPDGLRVYSWVSEWRGVLMSCGGNIRTGLKARLEGRSDDTTESVWLRANDGRKLSVVWPAGFTVSFDPDAVLWNDRGAMVARATDVVHLMDVHFDDASGTFDDPYIAHGGILDSCYSFFA